MHVADAHLVAKDALSVYLLDLSVRREESAAIGTDLVSLGMLQFEKVSMCTVSQSKSENQSSRCCHRRRSCKISAVCHILWLANVQPCCPSLNMCCGQSREHACVDDRSTALRFFICLRHIQHYMVKDQGSLGPRFTQT